MSVTVKRGLLEDLGRFKNVPFLVFDSLASEVVLNQLQDFQSRTHQFVNGLGKHVQKAQVDQLFQKILVLLIKLPQISYKVVFSRLFFQPVPLPKSYHKYSSVSQTISSSLPGSSSCTLALKSLMSDDKIISTVSFRLALRVLMVSGLWSPVTMLGVKSSPHCSEGSFESYRMKMKCSCQDCAERSGLFSLLKFGRFICNSGSVQWRRAPDYGLTACHLSQAVT